MTDQPLFSMQDIKTSNQVKNVRKAVAAKTSEKVKARLGKCRKRVEETIGSIEMDTTIHYASMGEWSMHDLLFHILKQTGPATIYISTWSVSELAVRQLIQKVKGGDIKKKYSRSLIGALNYAGQKRLN